MGCPSIVPDFRNPKEISMSYRLVLLDPLVAPRWYGSMWMVSWLVVSWFLGVSLLPKSLWGQADSSEGLDRYEWTAPSMGTSLEMIVYARDEAQARRAMDSGWDEIERLSKIVSNYDDQSEISQVCAKAYDNPLPISSELATLLRESRRWHRVSEGAFDITLGPLTRLWRQARKTQQLPSDREIERARGCCGWDAVLITDSKESLPATIELTKPHMWLDLSGIATGFILDRVFDKMVEAGTDRILINVGGDIRVGKAPPGAMGWRVQVAGLSKRSPPLAILELHDCAITSSGDLFQFVEIGGRRYSHFIDPVQGTPIERRQCVTAIAPTTIDADAGATAMAILGGTKGAALFDGMPLTTTFVMQSDLHESSPAHYLRIDRD